MLAAGVLILHDNTRAHSRTAL